MRRNFHGPNSSNSSRIFKTIDPDVYTRANDNAVVKDEADVRMDDE